MLSSDYNCAKEDKDNYTNRLKRESSVEVDGESWYIEEDAIVTWCMENVVSDNVHLIDRIRADAIKCSIVVVVVLKLFTKDSEIRGAYRFVYGAEDYIEIDNCTTFSAHELVDLWKNGRRDISYLSNIGVNNGIIVNFGLLGKIRTKIKFVKIK